MLPAQHILDLIVILEKCVTGLDIAKKSRVVTFIFILIATVSPGCKREIGSDTVEFLVRSTEEGGIPLLPFIRLWWGIAVGSCLAAMSVRLLCLVLLMETVCRAGVWIVH